MPPERVLAGATLLGAASGLRFFTGPAVLALRGRLVQGPARAAVVAAAAGELVGDKSPLVPPRTLPPIWAGRVAAGAVVGREMAGLPGAAAGALGAGVSTVAATRARKALGELTGLPDPVIGALEDGVAISAAAIATRTGEDEPESEPKVVRALRGAARGAFAGLFGTAVMTGAQLAYLRATGGDQSDTPERVGRKVVGGLLGKRVPRKHRDTLNQAMHWAYGTSWGVDLGVTAGLAGARPPILAGGAGLGIAAWAASLAQLPAFGVAPPPWRQPPGQLAVDAGLHLLYGVAVAAALKTLP